MKGFEADLRNTDRKAFQTKRKMITAGYAISGLRLR